MTAEEQRLAADRDRTAYWKRWGPYLSERQWGTVREDYSPDGAVYFPHDHARSSAYRWGEDGIAGILIITKDCVLPLHCGMVRSNFKERMFGLTGSESWGRCQRILLYIDNTPTHSYMKCLYKYPQAAFPIPN